ncbi:MAG TPA: ATP-binding cassette domain-containing protein [Baekduia sp.]|jgi:ABC-type Na+ transport system ATPase subunit NatA
MSGHGVSQLAPTVEVRGLTEHYGDRAAVDAIDLTVAVGDVYGFLGPNGAGKTTTLRMLLGLVQPTCSRRSARSPVATRSSHRARRDACWHRSPTGSRTRAATVVQSPSMPATPR